MKSWKYIKVFVSSTFKDMDIERDALKNLVEPQINDFLREYACTLEFVDLRHSVKTNSKMSLIEREKQIFNVCLEEIDHCKPYFIGIVGHRYGWIPSEDNVPCPQIEIPKDFPIARANLSVTMYEFLHGVFASNTPHERMSIFLRSEDSYQGISSQEKDDYFEQSDHANYIKEIREYIVANKNRFNAIEYTLPIASYGDSEILAWADTVCKKVKEMVKQEYLSKEISEYEKYTVAQENYVQGHICHYYGREKQINEFKKKLELKDHILITSKEYGLGLSSFFCKVYDEYRQNDKNICLIYCEDADPLFSANDAMVNFLMQMDRIDGKQRTQRIIESKGSQLKLIELWTELVISLSDKGYNIYRFCESVQSDSYFNQYPLHEVHTVSTVYYTDRMSFLRPMMYMLEPFDKKTISHAVEKFRKDVQKAIIRHPSSSNAKWLKLTTTIIEKMNKYDFNKIRNRDENDNEERILRYQIEIVNNLPRDFNEIVLYWGDRLKQIYGSSLINNYLFLMVLSPSGWRETDLSAILECDILNIITLRQMLGDIVISQTSVGLWGITDFEVKELIIKTQHLKCFCNLITRAYTYITGLPNDDPVYEGLVFRFALLNNDIPFCAKFIEQNLKGTTATSYYAREGFKWYASHYKLEFLNSIYNIISQKEIRSYNFYFNLLQWIKILSSANASNEQLAAVERMITTLRNLWQKKEIDLKAYSVVSDAVVTKMDYYRVVGDYKTMNDIMEYCLLLCKDYYLQDAMFLSTYFYCVMTKNEYIRERETSYQWLKKMFIRPEIQNSFSYPIESDITVYALLMHDAAKVMVETGNTDHADKLCVKSLNLLLEFLKKQQSDCPLETVLGPADTKRNLVVRLLQTLELNFHYDFLAWEELSPLCKEVFSQCEDCRNHDLNDISYVYYHKAKAAYILIEDRNPQEKVIELMEISDNIESDYTLKEGWKMGFLITEGRNNKYVEKKFEAWLYVNSIVLYILSSLPDLKIKYSNNNRGFGKCSYIITKTEYLSYKDHLKLVLPLIGAKQFRDDGLPPNKIWDAMIILYISMIQAELLNPPSNIQYLIGSFNSCVDIIQAIENRVDSIPKLLFINYLNNIKQVLYTNIPKDYIEKLDFNARYNDFSDCFGLAGDLFTSPNGMWANGDPDLAET